MGVDIKSIVGMVAKHKIAIVGILAGAAVFAGSSSFTSDAYSEPEFIDDENRTNDSWDGGRLSVNIEPIE
ncbi:hypothetical protein [Butyrivibrio sp. AE2015]|uniref:hypothetical protein n=1 Tax=Butyrivibrio sp. AE2015 TaxID=1280663 RepID=UPI0003B52804|nr:hypothetical protein [Butyrivibrio sp. AE2015]